MKHNDAVWSVVFSPDNRRLVSASRDKTACIWDVQTRQRLTPPLRHLAGVNYATFSSDSRWVATFSDDCTARVWDALTGEPLTPPLKHPGPVRFGRFLSNAKCPFTQCASVETRLWDLPQDSRPENDCSEIASILAVRRLISGELSEPLAAESLTNVWSKVRQKYPDDFNPVRLFTALSSGNASVLPFAAPMLLEVPSPSRQTNSQTRAAQLFEMIPRRDPSVNSNCVDLTLFYNVSLTESWLGNDPINLLIPACEGVRHLGGVDFDVRGLVQLSCNKGDAAAYARGVAGIKIGAKCRRLHLLHGMSISAGATNGEAIARVKIYRSKGEPQEKPIRFGIDVGDCSDQSSALAAPSTVAWTGTNSNGRALRLFKTTWDNPQPDIPIQRIDYISTLGHGAPFLVAITAEP